MVYELAPTAFDRVSPLFADRWFDEAFIDSIFEGTQSARIFVDDATAPRAALMCRTYEYYIAGATDVAPLRRFIADAPEEARVFADVYGYCTLDKEWERALLDDYAGQLRRIGRRRFRYDPYHIGATPRRPQSDDLIVVPVDRTLAQRIDTELLGDMPGIGFFMGGLDAFAAHGFGYCVIQDNSIASVAHTGSVSQGYADIDIITAEPFRGRGLATLAAQACIAETLRRGLVPTWHTDTTNEASMATARKLGFTEGRPFSQLSPPWGSKLHLSRGLWQSSTEEDADVVALWRRETPQ